METNDPAWELSKENVQPLKTGRKFCSLEAALQPNVTQTAKIKEEKQQFELELRTYKGDDPLSVWHGYILWMEQNYPKGSRTQLSQLLEQCMTQYKDDEKYKNDPRFLELWIKFAQLCTDPLEIYSYMYNQGISSALAAFYEAWANELEVVGNAKRADAIYQQGLDHCAQPADWLMHRHSDFQARVATRLASGETAMDVSDAGDRVSLGSLHAHGRRKKVGSVRIPLSKPVVLKGSQNHSSNSNVQGPGFTIYSEAENSLPVSLPSQTKQWAKVPVRSEVNRENERKAGKWTDAKVRQRSGFRSATTILSEPAFSIHQDEEQPAVTPRKVNPDVSLVLSSRKPQRAPHDPLSALTTTSVDIKQIAMYCKHLVYVGAEEFSLEEIRAANMMKHQEMAKNKQMEEERLKLEELLSAQRMELAAIEQQKLQLKRDLLQQQQVTITRMEAGMEAEKVPMPSACRTPVIGELENSASDSMSTQRLLAFQLSGSLHDADSSTVATKCTPNISTLSRTTPQHSCLTAPSPTVNTKDAMRLVMGLFNQSIASDKLGNISNSGASCSEPPSTKPAVVPPFTVFVDETPAKPSTQKPDLDDAENRAPTGYQNGPRRRGLAGILQPATDIPIKSSQYEEEIGEEILAQPLPDNQDEPMECMDGGPVFGDLTFAPGCSSTRNFTAIARQLTTSCLSKTLEVPLPDQQVVSGRPYTNSSETSQSGSTMTSQNGTLVDTMFVRSNLSCINEHSDEDAKLEGPAKKEAFEQQPVSASHTMAHLQSAKDTSLRHCSGSTPQSHQHSAVAEPTTTEAPITGDSLEKDPISSINQTCHEIDISHYIADCESAELLSQSVMVSTDHDPFDEDLIKKFLGRLERPIHMYSTYHHITGDMPIFKSHGKVTLGNKTYEVIRRIGEGAFAKVYEIRCVKAKNQNKASKVVKIQKPACPWEYYIIHELHNRLHDLKLHLRSAFMKVDAAYISDTGSCLVTELLPHGSILDVVNKVNAAGQPFPEPLSAVVAIHLLRTLEALMASDIIHGDIKPDNILFRGFSLIPEGSSNIPSDLCLQLIDFGRGIDMRMFPPATTFGVGIETSGFQCIEMMTGRPWTYQVDMFGIVGTLAVVIFGSYMKVRLENGCWKMNFTFRRWFKMKAAMGQLFDELLNVPSCTQLPDISQLRRCLEADFRRYHCTSYNKCVRNFTTLLSS